MNKGLSSIYKVISDEAMVAIVTIQPDGSCLYANQMAHDLLEFPLSYDINKFKISDLYPKNSSENRFKVFGEEILELQGLIQEIVINKLNGQTFIATLGIKKIYINEKEQTLLMIQDVTLQKKMQRELLEKQSAIHQAYQDLIRQNKQLQDLDVAKNRFIAITTHELRTPLSAMVGSAEILKLKLYDDEEQREEFINMIYDQGNHMLNLVNDILDFAKIQANKMDYFIEQKALSPIVKLEVDSLLSLATQSNIALTFNESLSSIQSDTCFFDEVRLRQVLTNLINNAVKYNKDGGTVDVFLKETDSHIQVYVVDTGPGISEENQPKIFDEFETLGKVANHGKGTGLGLAISRRMIVSMGGELHLKSEEGHGSTFWIDVPKNKVLPEENYRSRSDDPSGNLAA